ncbi:hypothetical protein AMAG_06327 [Allomyces macrogynus ATCC 38327]|uniref:Transmembrane protein n=1 Tax=Allomyces macrogynus (strain ATCC 38327) TaxID=578462 RepID=A0A0L0SGE6_ALLM3|nr:hypothetical protein AMAG_06327 [Allomyces macrogynus ATCC 38327]|eukprot:KNE61509.1 hypothetical protein AMAG_06327 [Allomyces macrogynus ATCC 38327]
MTMESRRQTAIMPERRLSHNASKSPLDKEPKRSPLDHVVDDVLGANRRVEYWMSSRFPPFPTLIAWSILAAMYSIGASVGLTQLDPAVAVNMAQYASTATPYYCSAWVTATHAVLSLLTGLTLAFVHFHPRWASIPECTARVRLIACCTMTLTTIICLFSTSVYLVTTDNHRMALTRQPSTTLTATLSTLNLQEALLGIFWFLTCIHLHLCVTCFVVLLRAMVLAHPPSPVAKYAVLPTTSPAPEVLATATVGATSPTTRRGSESVQMASHDTNLAGTPGEYGVSSAGIGASAVGVPDDGM